MSSESTPVRESEERLMDMTWRCWPHWTPCQEQWVVFVVHEERELVGSVVMEEDLKESKVWGSEMCVVEMGREWSVRKRSNDRRRRILFLCVREGDRNGE